jgi:CheY-like chemotaxis protein
VYSKGRILVVDDDTAFANLICRALENEGYEAARASDGLTALEMLRTFRPDLVCLDMYLPGINGWDFLKKYAVYLEPHVPIIAMSAGNIDPASMSGVSEFLQKPFDIALLLNSVERLTTHS